MHVISGGTILDGSGSPGFTGDVAIEGERIIAAGGKAGAARQGIGAGGRGQNAGGCPGRLVRAGR